MEERKNIILTTTGIFFILAGLAAIYFFIVRGIKPEFLQLDVFTLYSKYIETKSDNPKGYPIFLFYRDSNPPNTASQSQTLHHSPPLH